MSDAPKIQLVTTSIAPRWIAAKTIRITVPAMASSAPTPWDTELKISSPSV